MDRAVQCLNVLVLLYFPPGSDLNLKLMMPKLEKLLKKKDALKTKNASGQYGLGWLRSKRIVVRTGDHVPHNLWSGMSFVFRLVNEVRAGRWVVCPYQYQENQE